MQCFYSSPMFMHPMHVPTMHHPMYARAHRRACSPCVGFNPFMLLAFMIFAPMLFRLALFVVFHVVAPIALVGVAVLMSSFVGACEDDTATSCSTSHNADQYPEAMKACFAKMKAESSKERTHARAGKTEDTSNANSTGPRRYDLSSVSLATTADGATVTVATPGVKEVEVTVVEQTLRVKGETTINGDTFCVDQTILIPSGLDLDSAKATHENGEAVVTVKKTAGKRIVVNAVKKDMPEAMEAEAEKNEGGSLSSDGEWEPLNTE